MPRRSGELDTVTGKIEIDVHRRVQLHFGRVVPAGRDLAQPQRTAEMTADLPSYPVFVEGNPLRRALPNGQPVQIVGSQTVIGGKANRPGKTLRTFVAKNATVEPDRERRCDNRTGRTHGLEFSGLLFGHPSGNHRASPERIGKFHCPQVGNSLPPVAAQHTYFGKHHNYSVLTPLHSATVLTSHGRNRKG